MDGQCSIMNIKGVIFDLDGTLIDTLEDIAGAANRTLAAFGFTAHPVENYRYFVGDGARTLVQRILPTEKRDSDIVDEILKNFKDDYSRNWNDKSQPYDGIHDLLKEISGMGIQSAILSNKPHEYTVLCADEFFPARPFELVLGMRDEVPAKPDPAGAFEIADALSMKPEEILFLGDSIVDIKTANAAGMFSVGALWGFRGEAELGQSGANALAASPPEILKFLEQQLQPSG